MRIRCTLFGCSDHHVYPACERCGEGIYDDFIQRGWLTPAIDWFASSTRRAWWFICGRRCEICKRWYWRGRDECCCSEECYSKWIPF